MPWTSRTTDPALLARHQPEGFHAADPALDAGSACSAHHPGDAVRRPPDSPTIALCLSAPWAHFRTTKAAVKMAARPAGQHSEFYPHLGWRCTTFMPSICSCRKPEPSTSWIVAAARLYVLSPSRGLLRHACQVEHRCSSRLFGAGIARHPTISRGTRQANFCGASASLRDAGLHHQQLLACRHHLRALQKPLAGGTLPSGQHLRIKQFYGTSENAVKTQIWIAVSVAIVKAPRPGRLALHFVTDPLGDPLRENAHTSSTCGRRKQMQRFANNQPIEFIRFLTGH